MAYRRRSRGRGAADARGDSCPAQLLHRSARFVHRQTRPGRPTLWRMSLIDTHSDSTAAPALPAALRLGAVAPRRSPTSTAPSRGTSSRSACACTATTADDRRARRRRARRRSSCTRTRRRGPPAATPACTTTRCCTRRREELARAAVRLARDADADRGRLRPPHPRGDLPARRRRQRDRAGRGSPARAVAGRPRLRPRPGPARLRQPARDRRRRAADRRTSAEGLRMGHLHLHVGDIDEGARLLPRRPRLRASRRTSARPRSSPPAATTTTSASTSGTARASAAPPPHTVGLRHWTVELPSDADVAEVRARVTAAGISTDPLPAASCPRPLADRGRVPRRRRVSIGRRVRASATSVVNPSPYLSRSDSDFAHGTSAMWLPGASRVAGRGGGPRW